MEQDCCFSDVLCNIGDVPAISYVSSMAMSYQVPAVLVARK